jgi:carboxypeptidase Q
MFTPAVRVVAGIATIGAASFIWTTGLTSPRDAHEALDQQAIARIREEGVSSRSELARSASRLTDYYGPRLTGSKNLDAAGAWVASTLQTWGLANVNLEPWSDEHIATGWQNEGFYLAVLSPQFFPLIGTSAAWTPGTTGRVHGRVVLVVEKSLDEVIARHGNGSLKNTWVLRGPPPPIAPLWSAPARRLTDEDVARGEREADKSSRPVSSSLKKVVGSYKRLGDSPDDGLSPDQWFRQQGVLGILHTDARGHNAYASVASTPRLANPQTLAPTIVIPAESFGRLARLVTDGVPVTIEGDIKNVFVPQPHLFNVIGEIPGSDKADEVVMLGAHLDSWHVATGATDNAAGCAMVLEAMRILVRSGVPLRRTVRVALWSGEEQGLLGSKAYVANYLRRRQATPQRAETITAYFNLDNGTGRLRGLYVGGTASDLTATFKQWMTPFDHMDMRHLSRARGGHTDHVSFQSAGIPAWQFIQDPIAYSLTHHTSLDSYEQLQMTDLRDSATILASFVMFAANRETPLSASAVR